MSKGNTIAVIIQARTGSTRLPNKILKNIIGKPSIIHSIERIKRMKTINKIVIATTELVEDDIIVKTVNKYENNIFIYRGELEDVLDRYYQAAKKIDANVVVRITSDNPLIDPEISDLTVKTFFDKQCDYCCNNMPRTYPIGLDTEVFSFAALKKTWEEAKTSYEREHVTPYIRQNKDKFNIINISNNVDLSHLRWTMDYKEDFEFIKTIYERLYPKNKTFSMKDILDLLKHEPKICEINSKYI